MAGVDPGAGDGVAGYHFTAIFREVFVGYVLYSTDAVLAERLRVSWIMIGVVRAVPAMTAVTRKDFAATISKVEECGGKRRCCMIMVW